MDLLADKGDCMRDPKPGDQTWNTGCPAAFVEEDEACCSGSFLLEYCVNKPCNKTGAHLRGIVRHSERLNQVSQASETVFADHCNFKAVLSGCAHVL